MNAREFRTGHVRTSTRNRCARRATTRMNFHAQACPRRLVLVLGDQLNRDSAAFDGFDPACDAVWMAEVAEESTHVWSHHARYEKLPIGRQHNTVDIFRLADLGRWIGESQLECGLTAKDQAHIPKLTSTATTKRFRVCAKITSDFGGSAAGPDARRLPAAAAQAGKGGSVSPCDAHCAPAARNVPGPALPHCRDSDRWPADIG